MLAGLRGEGSAAGHVGCARVGQRATTVQVVRGYTGTAGAAAGCARIAGERVQQGLSVAGRACAGAKGTSPASVSSRVSQSPVVCGLGWATGGGTRGGQRDACAASVLWADFTCESVPDVARGARGFA